MVLSKKRMACPFRLGRRDYRRWRSSKSILGSCSQVRVNRSARLTSWGSGCRDVVSVTDGGGGEERAELQGLLFVTKNKVAAAAAPLCGRGAAAPLPHCL